MIVVTLPFEGYNRKLFIVVSDSIMKPFRGEKKITQNQGIPIMHKNTWTLGHQTQNQLACLQSKPFTNSWEACMSCWMPPKISTAKKFYEHLELQSQQQYQHLSQDPL